MKQCHYIKLKTVSIIPISFIILWIYNPQGIISHNLDQEHTRTVKKVDRLKNLYNKFQV
jgi:hypothetical protein